MRGRLVMAYWRERGSSRPTGRSLLVALALVVVGSVALSAVAGATTSKRAQDISVALITKDATNPFFVKMRAGATAEAKRLGAELRYAAGKSSSDNAGQITAIENMVTAGVKGILITVADGKAQVPAILKARKAGVLVIALDTPTVPKSASVAVLGTVGVSSAITTMPAFRAFRIAGTCAFPSATVMRIPLTPAVTMFSIAVIWPALSELLLPAA